MIKIDNFKIANYMGYTFESLDNNVFNHNYETHHRYDSSWDNLIPVVLKMQSEHRSMWTSNSFGFSEIRTALANLNFTLLYRNIVKWIDLQNKRK